jgi:hypothetical protein
MSISIVLESGSKTSIKTIVGADFEVLVGIFINESRAPYCKPFYLCWQGYGTNYSCTSSFRSFNNPFCRLVQNAMIVGFQADADFLFSHIYSTYSRIFVITPAPTVRPPSRIANFEPCSNATGTINSTSRFTLSPGITISTPSGSLIFPVTSIVRM